MKKIISTLSITLLLFTSCSQKEKNIKHQEKRTSKLAILKFDSSGNQIEKPILHEEGFAFELATLKEYFQIPGLSVLVKEGNQIIYEDYLGKADYKNSIPLDSTVTFPIASLTKIFSAIVIFQLEAEGKLSLEDPISKYAPSYNFSDAIKVKHILSHTSQGEEIGQHFYYSNRFSLITNVIEKTDNQSFEISIKNRIIDKLGLKNTYLLKDASQLTKENRKIAAPYFLGGEMKNGFLSKEAREGVIEYGFSSSSGITSTVKDLAIFDNAFNNNELISKTSKSKMFQAFNDKSPYGLGIFSQEFLGEKLVWGYGQYDCYSSLLLKIPNKDLTFLLMANNNLLSDPARLINGDVTTSLFALSFLKNYVFKTIKSPLLESKNSLNELQGDTSEFYYKKLIAQSLAASYMARFDNAETVMSKQILEKVFEKFPDAQNKANLNVLFNLQLLKFMDAMRKQQDFTDYDIYYKNIATSLFSIDMNNPYANYYMGNYYQMKEIEDSTSFYYKRIVNAKNWLRERKE